MVEDSATTEGAAKTGIPASRILKEVYTKIDEAARELGREKEELAGERRKLEEDKERFKAEKEKMKAVVESGDIVRLNCGGQYITTHRATLCEAENSMLAAMFSGRWEDSLPKDPSGAIFLDVDPWFLETIINYLRLRRLLGPIPLPRIPEDKRVTWDGLIDYYQLKDFLHCPSATIDFSFVPRLDLVGSGVFKDKVNKIRKDASSGHAYALGSTPLTKSVAWRVKMLNLTQWAFAGVVGSTGVTNNSQRSPTSYGWAGAKQVHEGGKILSAKDGWTGWGHGDQAVFRLDMEASRLLMKHAQTSRTYVLDLPRDVQQWYVHVNLHDASSEIEVLRARPDDDLP